jgi:hypothetical protein
MTVTILSFANVSFKPPRPQPKVHQLQLRSHKLAILLTVPPSMTFEAIKADALSALTSDVNQVEGIPKVKSENDFEVCRAIKDKGKATGAYEVMDVSKQVREYNLASWDTLYLQFRNTATGKHFFPIIFSTIRISTHFRHLQYLHHRVVEHHR